MFIYFREREAEFVREQGREKGRERETERTREGQRERERERESQAGSTLSAQSPMWGSNTRTMRL